MPAISENFADLLEPGLRKIFTDQYNQVPEMYQSIFNVNTTDKPYEKDSSVGAFGDMEPFNGQISYDEVYQGLNHVIDPVKFSHMLETPKATHTDNVIIEEDNNGQSAGKNLCDRLVGWYIGRRGLVYAG